MKKLLFRYFLIFQAFICQVHNSFTQVSNDSITVKGDSIKMLIDYKAFDIFEYRAYNFTAGIRTVIIPQALLENNSSLSSLSDALQSIGAVYMRSYGNSMNNAITLRGFGPERTTILWNGIALNNAGLGQLDMNLMPGGFFNSIHLIEGSSSTQYGNGAQGGSLLLEYTPDFKNSFNLKLQQEFGSFFSWNTSAQANYGNKNFQGRTAFLRNSSTNNYSYKDKTTAGFPIREIVNADFFSYQIMQDLFFRMKKNWLLSVHGWYTYTDRKVPPTMGAANNHSEQFDHNFKVMTQLKKSFNNHAFQFQLAYLQDNLIYHTDAFKDSSLIHSGQAQVQYVWNPSNKFTFMAGGNFSVNYSEYKYYINSVIELRGNAFVLANLNLMARGVTHYRTLKISTGIRQQFSTNYTSLPSAHAGLDYYSSLYSKGKQHGVYISVGVNSAYRMPTLNDLYWVPGGNPNLKPEYSWNVENSYKYEIKASKYKFLVDVLGYFGRTSNWIQWTPTPFGYWAPQNITTVQSAGFEGGSQFDYKKNQWGFSSQVRYNFTHTTDINNGFKQLVYVPLHTIKSTLKVEWKHIYLTILPSFFSQRFTLTDNTQSIPSFFLLSIQTGYQLNIKSCSIGFFGRLNNVTNSDYQMIINRPMPGINFNIGVNFNFNLQTTKQNNK